MDDLSGRRNGYDRGAAARYDIVDDFPETLPRHVQS